jgi:gliding motility-associated-like protein
MKRLSFVACLGLGLLFTITQSVGQVYPSSFRKISKLSGDLAVPVDPGAVFGIMSSAIGDLDDDGVMDLAVGATNQGGFAVGAVYILFMKNNGTVKSSKMILSSEPSSDADSFGSSISALGDLDDDGVEDIGVGAGYDNGETGALWILFMKKDGSVKARQKIDATDGGFTGSLQFGWEFGSGSSGIGDLDGDGNSEVAVGARYSGKVYILFLNDNGTVKKYKTISSADGLDIDLAGLVGYQVAGLGDVNLDGIPDLAIGGHRSDVGSFDSGVVFVVFLTNTGGVKGNTRISTGLANFNDTAKLLGVGLVGISDYNGDGIPDMAVGGDDTGANTGAIWYLMLNSNGTVKSSHKVSSQSSNSDLVLHTSDFFGGSISYLGDLNGDGIPDLAVGAFLDDDGGNDSGAIWITIPKCAPVQTFAGDDQQVCTSQPVKMNATLTAGATGLWIVVAGSGVFSDIRDPKATVTQMSEGENQFKWTVATPPCGTTTDIVTVAVQPKPTAHVAMPDTTYTCAKDFAIKADKPNGPGEWSVTKGSANIAEPGENETTIVFNERDAPVTVTWTVTANGCPPAESTATLIPFTVSIEKIPNVITPNSDGLNDHWQIPNVQHAESQVRLYNRWGEQVFYDPSYKNTWSGANVAPGVYFFFINVVGCEKEFKGWLSVVN